MKIKDLKNMSPQEIEAFVAAEQESYKQIWNKSNSILIKKFSIKTLFILVTISVVLVFTYHFAGLLSFIVVSSTIITGLYVYQTINQDIKKLPNRNKKNK